MKAIITLVAVSISLTAVGSAAEIQQQKRSVRIIDMSIDSPHRVLESNKARSTIASSEDQNSQASGKTRSQ